MRSRKPYRLVSQVVLPALGTPWTNNCTRRAGLINGSPWRRWSPGEPKVTIPRILNALDGWHKEATPSTILAARLSACGITNRIAPREHVRLRKPIMARRLEDDYEDEPRPRRRR